MDKARKKEITANPILWDHFQRKDGTCSVKLKVTSNRQTKYYPIQRSNKNIFLEEADWIKLNEWNVRGELKEIKDCIARATVGATDAIERITKGGKPFTFDRFEKAYFAQEENLTGFVGEFKAMLDQLFQQGRIGTYRAYLTTYHSLKNFLKKRKKPEEISPYDITPDLLYDYERYLMEERGASRTTVGIYTRVFRVVYNRCIELDRSLRDSYPFGSRGSRYKVQHSMKGLKSKGDALTIEQLRTFVSSTPEPGSPEWEAKQYWLFSFYCQGMNFRDIFFLKYSNIQGQYIRYTREKTKRTEDQEILEIPLSPQITEIIAKLGNPDKRSSSYVFDVLKQGEKDILRIEATIMQKIQVTNARLKRLCLPLGLPGITTYWSRHTYASLLKMAGVSVELIRELLGHSNIKTTEHYLKRFDYEVKKQANQRITELLLAS